MTAPGPGRAITWQPPPPPEKAPSGWQVVGLVLMLMAVGWLGAMWLGAGKPVGVGLVEVPLLLLLTAPLIVTAARTERRFDLAGLLVTGFALRLFGCYYRFTHAADAATYHDAGAQLARSFRNLDFNVDTGSQVPGTGGMKIIAGIAEVFTNSNAFATFLLFTWLGFIGCYLFYRAFVTAMPDADHRRYALLIFLWPTLVFWPSSIGKDCWLLFTLGIASLGAARVLARRRGGYSLLAVGLLAGSFVRPHVSLLLVVAFGIALLVGRRQARAGALTAGTIGKIAGLLVILLLGAVLATRTADFLNANDINGVDSAITGVGSRTAEGGSAFVPADPTNPLGYGKAAVTVLLRPFPFEAHGLESIATSFEGLLLLGLLVVSVPRLRSVPRRLRSDPYVTLALGYVLAFVFAFGTIGNFGILARERSQVMPYVFVLLALPKAARIDWSRRQRRRIGSSASVPPRPPSQPRPPPR